MAKKKAAPKRKRWQPTPAQARAMRVDSKRHDKVERAERRAHERRVAQAAKAKFHQDDVNWALDHIVTRCDRDVDKGIALLNAIKLRGVDRLLLALKAFKRLARDLEKERTATP